MQLVLDIEENKKDIVLNIIQNLKDGIIKSYSFKSPSSDKIEYLSKEEEEDIKNILDNLTKDDKQIEDIREYSIDL